MSLVLMRSLRSLIRQTFRRHPSSLAKRSYNAFRSLDTFPNRHIGPSNDESTKMLTSLGYSSMDDFIKDTVPPSIRLTANPLDNHSIPSLSESELYRRAKQVASANKVMRSYIGMGYHNAVVPPVILRNVRLFLCQYLECLKQNIYIYIYIPRSLKVPHGILHTPHTSQK